MSEHLDRSQERELECRRLRAHAAAAAMFGVESHHREDFVATFGDCWSPEFVELMIGLAKQMRSHEPLRAARLARLAVLAAECTTTSGEDRLAQLLVLATAEEGNAYRLAGRLDLAAQTLDKASLWANALDVDTQLIVAGMRAQVLDLQGKPAIGEELISRPLSTAREASPMLLFDYHVLAANFLAHSPVRSLAHAESALRSWHPSCGPRHLGGSFYSLGLGLVRLGMTSDGLRFLRRSALLFRRFGSPADRTRVIWAIGRADQYLGRWNAAVEHLELALISAQTVGQPILRGIVALDLSRTHALAGHWLRAGSTAEIGLQAFLESCSERHQQAARAVLANSQRARRSSAAQISRIVDRLV